MPLQSRPISHRKYWAAFFVSMTLLALIVRWHVVQLNREVRREGLSSRVYITTRSVLINILDVETGLRGYLIGGKPEYLRPYYEGLGRLSDDFARLKALTVTIQSEWPHVQATDQAVTHVLEEFRNQVEIGEEEGIEAARGRFIQFPTKPTIDLIRDHLLAIQVEETRKIDEAGRTLDAQMVATLWLLNAFVGISGILCFAMIAGLAASPTEPDGDPVARTD